MTPWTKKNIWKCWKDRFSFFSVALPSFFFFYSIPSFSFFVFSTKQNKKCTETVVEAKLEKKEAGKYFKNYAFCLLFPENWRPSKILSTFMDTGARSNFFSWELISLQIFYPSTPILYVVGFLQTVPKLVVRSYAKIIVWEKKDWKLPTYILSSIGHIPDREQFSSLKTADQYFWAK